MCLAANTPFVVFGDDWGRHVSTMQHLFQWIIPRYPVIWVNGIGHRLPRLRWSDAKRAAAKLTAARRPLRHSGESRGNGAAMRPHTIINPRVLPWHHWPAVHTVNTHSLLRVIKRALQQYHERPVLVTGSPPSVGVVGRLNERVSVYYCMDDFLHHPAATARVIAPLERRLLARVDLLVATAQSLTLSKPVASGRAYHLPQGVNFEHFALPRSAPPELRVVPRPIIGFAGRLSDCCDLDLLGQVARRFADASLVIVGPLAVDPGRLTDLPNVHFLGHRPYDELPAYVQQFDVGLVPYVINDWTRAVDPLKLLEYLAAGVPVVATAIPEARKYDAVIRVTDGEAGFMLAIRQALVEQGDVARSRARALAKEHTWERRAQAFLDIVTGAAEERMVLTEMAEAGRAPAVG